MQLYDFNIRYIILTMMRFKKANRNDNQIYHKYHQEKLEEEIKQLKEQLQQEKKQNKELENYLRSVEQKNRELYKKLMQQELYYVAALAKIKEKYEERLIEETTMKENLMNKYTTDEKAKKFRIQAIIELNKQIKVLKNELKKIKQEKKYLEDNYDDIVKLAKKQVENIEKENDDAVEEYKEFAMNNYQALDKQIQEIMNNKVRNRLIFGDKMPMQYFINYYNLKVSAAFSGCSTETEPSAATIAYLVNKAKEEKIPVILYIELNTDKVAKTIADEVGNGCKAMQIQSLHNVSLNDFNAGETYITLMNRNIDVLKKALQ